MATHHRLSSNHSTTVEAIRRIAQPFNSPGADDRLLDVVGDARVVLLGEASHGTHEFYCERAELTQRLIAERGFTAVAAEADWPDAYRANCYVRGAGQDRDAGEALAGFRRFPHWMWRNRAVEDFIQWLRQHNERSSAQAGFYGLDLYSLRQSMEAVVAYLEKVDPAAARRARYRYSCFDAFGEDPQAYGYAASFALDQSCQQAVLEQLRELQQRALDYARLDGRVVEDEIFFAEQNARVAKNAEEYYRTMFSGRVSSWNLRDRHMAGTLDALLAHLGRNGSQPKIVVWAHNSHIGDARATAMGDDGELNIGQLARERYGRDARLIGFTTYDGTVTAASDWGGPAERKHVRPALPGSVEALFHATGRPAFFIDLRDPDAAAALRPRRLERAIGVVYRPRTERLSHYFDCHLADQFDAVIHLDRSRAVEPLERTPGWDEGEVAETYPSGV